MVGPRLGAHTAPGLGLLCRTGHYFLNRPMFLPRRSGQALRGVQRSSKLTTVIFLPGVVSTTAVKFVLYGLKLPQPTES